jgi:hypothetical protein
MISLRGTNGKPAHPSLMVAARRTIAPVHSKHLPEIKDFRHLLHTETG